MFLDKMLKNNQYKYIIMIINSIFCSILFNYLSGCIVCEKIFNLTNINYYTFSGFLLISSSTRFLEGTSNNSDKYICYSLFILSRLFFFFLYLNTIRSFIPEILYSSNIFYILPLYLPFYLDGGEFSGSYILSSNSLIRKYLYKILKYSSHELYVKDPNLYFDQAALLGIHPHGLIPLGLVNNCLLNPDRKELFLKHIPHVFNYGMGSGATTNFFFPLIREFYLIIGAVDCSKPIMKKFLNKKYTIGVFLGGARESKYSGIGKSDLIITKRLGFFKLALQTGRPILPIYTFGENNFFNAINEQKMFLFELFHRLTGLWFPLGYLSFKKTKIITVIGDPIFVEKIENPTTKDIISLQNNYKENLTELFDQFKHLDQSCKNNKLNFIE